MVSRRDLKDVHEISVLKSFKEYLKKQNSTLTVLHRPDPPDAIVKLNGKDTWIEITDAFYSPEVAISITSYAAGNVTHRPSEGGLVGNPDETTSREIESVISEKLNKSTMTKLVMSHGKGILLVGLFGPFFDIDEIENNFSDVFRRQLENQTVFDSVYLYESCHKNVHHYKKIV